VLGRGGLVWTDNSRIQVVTMQKPEMAPLHKNGGFVGEQSQVAVKA